MHPLLIDVLQLYFRAMNTAFTAIFNSIKRTHFISNTCLKMSKRLISMSQQGK